MAVAVPELEDLDLARTSFDGFVDSVGSNLGERHIAVLLPYAVQRFEPSC
jgi:hypothetical protein